MIQDYYSLPEVSSTFLRAVEESPWGSQQGWVKEPTSAMALGTAVHCALLESSEFGRRYPRPPAGVNRNSKVWKSWEYQQLPGAERWTEKEWLENTETARRIRTSIDAHPIARTLLLGKGRNEVVLRGDINGVACKCKIDRLTELDGLDGRVIVDIKTMYELPTVRRCGYAILDRRYDFQMGFYRRLAQTNGIKVAGVVIVFLQTRPPYEICNRELTKQQLQVADAQIDTALGSYRACLEANEWPRTNPDIVTASPVAADLEEPERWDGL